MSRLHDDSSRMLGRFHKRVRNPEIETGRLATISQLVIKFRANIMQTVNLPERQEIIVIPIKFLITNRALFRNNSTKYFVLTMVETKDTRIHF